MSDPMIGQCRFCGGPTEAGAPFCCGGCEAQYVMRERQREVVEKMLTERTKMRDDSRWFLTDAAAERYRRSQS